MERIRMLKVAPGQPPEVIEADHTLEMLQELVGGTLQAVYPWEDYVCILCDDDGKAKGYPPNRVLVDDEGEPYDIIVGTFYICGLSKDNFASITDEMAEKYMERFRYPEMLMRTLGGGILWFRLGSGEEPRLIG